ncbi:hypothetical protein [Shewanella sp. KCT]|uniref:hypothetical protein n=1 Tax=Shewanella sp. KCT TaxID=2569535 RepID=UPI00118295A8|nr:hypothetical protein [Shewanella sp. KCT]TVP11758.1 hypothetical protein AYI87_15110 [Shewanella sp. KCT]
MKGQISFTSEMMQAILDGNKTQTRRPIKPEIVSSIEFMGGSNEESKEFDFIGLTHEAWKDDSGNTHDPEWLVYCTEYPEEGVTPIGKLYGALGDKIIVTDGELTALVEIIGFRAERLQDISEQDAWAEGCEGYDDDVTGGKNGYSEFSELWASIYGDESWQSNPWVWVIDFKVICTGKEAA